MNDPVAAFLAARSCLVLDGALATELQRRGADLADPLWSAKCLLEHPALIRAVHRDYFAAGADVATTATYQASFEGFARRAIAPREAAELMRAAVALACAARDEFWRTAAGTPGRRRPLVAASVGPYGAMLADGSEYRGRYAVDEGVLEAFHRPRLAVLAAAGADLLACETIPELREARVLARLIGELPGVAAWISFSCRDGTHTCGGDDFGDCMAEFAAHAQVVATGVNCSAPEHVDSLLEHARGRTHKPLLVYANSGEAYDATHKCWTGAAQVIPLAARAAGWRARGARLIGGCCRTTPQDIAHLRAALDG